MWDRGDHDAFVAVINNFNHTLTVFLLSSETALTSSRGAGSLCSSTLERLKGFTCSAEPGVRRSDAQRQEKKTDSASSKVCDQGSSVWPPQDISDRHSNENRLQQSEEEHEDEEEEVKEKESLGLAAAKQVPNINVAPSHLCCLSMSLAAGRTKNGGLSLHGGKYLPCWSAHEQGSTIGTGSDLWPS